MIELSLRAILLPLTRPNPRLYISSLTDLMLGYPHVMYGSAILNILIVALLSFTNVPLLICLSLNSCITFLGLGGTPLILQKENRKLCQVDVLRVTVDRANHAWYCLNPNDITLSVSFQCNWFFIWLRSILMLTKTHSNWRNNKINIIKIMFIAKISRKIKHG